MDSVVQWKKIQHGKPPRETLHILKQLKANMENMIEKRDQMYGEKETKSAFMFPETRVKMRGM